MRRGAAFSNIFTNNFQKALQRPLPISTKKKDIYEALKELLMLLSGDDKVADTWATKITNEIAHKAIGKTASTTIADSDGSYMSVQHLRELRDHAGELLDKIDAGTPLPDWLESKITESAAHLRSVYEYAEHGQKLASDEVGKNLNLSMAGFDTAIRAMTAFIKEGDYPASMKRELVRFLEELRSLREEVYFFTHSRVASHLQTVDLGLDSATTFLWDALDAVNLSDERSEILRISRRTSALSKTLSGIMDRISRESTGPLRMINDFLSRVSLS